MCNPLVVIATILFSHALTWANPSQTNNQNLHGGSQTPLDESRLEVPLSNSVRMIRNAKNSAYSISEKSSYAHLIIIPPRDIGGYHTLIHTGGFRKVNSFSIWHAGQRYDHWVINLLGQVSIALKSA